MIQGNLFRHNGKPIIHHAFEPKAEITLVHGNTLETLRQMPAGCAKLVISSPPYNIGKEYEARKELEHYLDTLRPILAEVVEGVSQ